MEVPHPNEVALLRVGPQGFGYVETDEFYALRLEAFNDPAKLFTIKDQYDRQRVFIKTLTWARAYSANPATIKRLLG